MVKRFSAWTIVALIASCSPKRDFGAYVGKGGMGGEAGLGESGSGAEAGAFEHDGGAGGQEVSGGQDPLGGAGQGQMGEAGGGEAGSGEAGSGEAGASSDVTHDCKPGVEAKCSAADPALRGACASGHVTCASDGHWRACDVTPAASDRCDVPGDDSDCNGSPNTGCRCVTGDTAPCGPQTDQGVCEFGSSECKNSTWGACVGPVLPGIRSCTSSKDNDCDGVLDNTLDSTCECAPGATQACGAHPGLDGKGRCKAGTQTCVAAANGSSSAWSACTGALGPAAAETCDDDGVDENCDGRVNENPPCACLNGQARACGNCNAGTQHCAAGAWGACQNDPALVTYYRDVDGDGFGDATKTTTSCSGAPLGYVASKTDCCDKDALTHPGMASFFESLNACASMDYDCSGTLDLKYPSATDCRSSGGGWLGAVAACPGTGTWAICACDEACYVGSTLQNYTQYCH